MSSYDRLMRRLARESQAPDAAAEALYDRLQRGELATIAPLPELDGLAASSEERAAALGRRLAAPRPAPVRWRLPAFAAVAALLGLALWFAPAAPDPPALVAAADPPSPLPHTAPENVDPAFVELVLGESGSTLLAHGVALAWEGEGRLVQDGSDTDVVWTAGRLRVEVPPGQGLSVQVRGPDARVEVVGTVFVVERGPEGTRTTVERGAVGVTCTGDEPTVLPAGESAACQRRRASALLASSRRMEARGASIDAILATLDSALLDDTAPEPIEQELLFLSAVWLERRGDRADAAERLRRCLDLGGGLRAPDAREMLARLGD